MSDEIFRLRIVLFAIFLSYPVVFLQSQFLRAVANPFSGLGPFFLTMALVASILVALTFNHVFGYVTLVSVTISDLAFGMPLLVFAPHIAVVLAFAEGTVSLQPYHAIAKTIIQGEQENIALNIRLCFHRLRRKLLSIFVTLFLLSTGFGLLPTIVPASASVLGLPIYAIIALLVFGIIVLYLGTAE